MAIPAETPTLFGAYVQSISTSIGWGGQGSSCQFSLVEDPENGVNINLPTIGTAVAFEYGKFSFGGVFQRYTYQESLSGRIYNVVIESPAKLLDGIQVILDEFQGTAFEPANGFYGPWNGFSTGTKPTEFTYGSPYTYNIWNPFAELENYEKGGNFGNADVNSAGFPVVALFEMLQKFGTRADMNFGGKARFGKSVYAFDFTEVIDALNTHVPFYRVKGPVQSLNNILADVCDVIQHDYFPQITGNLALSTNNVLSYPIIKIRMLSRASQPSSGIIKDFVASTKESGTLISSAVGEEFSSATTQKVVLGAPVTRYYNGLVQSMTSVWGKTSNGGYLLGGPAISVYPNASSSNQVALQYPDTFGAQRYMATVFELRMALGGMETWTTYKAFQSMAEVEPNSNLYIGDYPPWTSQVYTTQAMLQNLADGGAMADAMSMINTDLKQVENAYTKAQNDLQQKIFNVVSKAATEFYGQQFFVRLPFEDGGMDNNLRFITEDTQYEASWEITDSAWYYDLNGNESSPISDVASYDGTGKLRSHSVFLNDGISDFSAFGSEYAFGFGGHVCTSKGGPDKDIYWDQKKGPSALVRTGAQVRAYDSYTTADEGLTVLANLFFGIYIDPERYKGTGKQSAQISIPPAVSLPTAIGVPQKSNRYLWGPWYVNFGNQGNAEVVIDNTLSPETFGSRDLLNQVGIATAVAGIGQMESVESGFVEVAEFPQFNVGDRFALTGPYVTDLNIDVSPDGCKCTYRFNTWTPNFGKLTKYNIDRIARIRTGGIAFAQQQRARREKRPFPKFATRKGGDGGFADLMHEMFVRMGADGFSQMIDSVTG